MNRLKISLKCKIILKYHNKKKLMIHYINENMDISEDINNNNESYNIRKFPISEDLKNNK